MNQKSGPRFQRQWTTGLPVLSLGEPEEAPPRPQEQERTLARRFRVQSLEQRAYFQPHAQSPRDPHCRLKQWERVRLVSFLPASTRTKMPPHMALILART